MSSDNQFTALGPTIIGFQTHGTNIDRGADIAGNQIGIRGNSNNGVGILGESTNNVGVRGTSHSKTGVEGVSAVVEGVFGLGSPGVLGTGVKNGSSGHNGVMGIVEGSDGAGVFGGHRNPDPNAPVPPPLGVATFGPVGPPGAGVIGVSNDDGNGVIGRSHFGHGVVGRAEGGVEFKSHGVFGQSNQTAGVVGIAGRDGDENKNNFFSGRAGVFGFSDQGTGVFGSSNERSTQGVRGSSVDGTGVLGTSKHDRGGVFQSGDADIPGDKRQLVPQLQLRPQSMPVPGMVPASPQMFIPSEKFLPTLPKEGRGGDFLVTEDDRNRSCTLWFCIKGQDGENMAQWSQVLLGNPIPGLG